MLTAGDVITLPKNVAARRRAGKKGALVRKGLSPTAAGRIAGTTKARKKKGK